MRLRFKGILASSYLFCLFLTQPAVAEDSERLWVYAPVNFQVDTDTDRLVGLLARAKKAGYNGVVITDYKFGKLDERPANYYRNLKRTREMADRLEIELIPLVMQIGYSNSILQNNPNLAAGLPVKDCEFVVDGDEAALASNRNLLDGGGFETAERNKPTGWDWIDGFGTSTVLDTKVIHSGMSALSMQAFRKVESSGGNCRVVKRVALKPFHEYRLTMWVKSDGLRASEFKFMPLSVGDHAVALESCEPRCQTDAGLDASPNRFQFAAAQGRQHLPWVMGSPVRSSVDRRCATGGSWRNQPVATRRLPDPCS